MVVLTADDVIKGARVGALSEVVNFNSLGNDLHDLSILAQMPQVEVLSLSINNLKSLRFFQPCDRLRELYLRRNEIEDLAELGYLTGLAELKVLWLSHNPIASNPNYRMTVLRALPALQKLDDTDVTPEEVALAQKQGVEVAPKELVADADDGAAVGDTDGDGGEGGVAPAAVVLAAIKALLPLLGDGELSELGDLIAAL